MKREKFTWEPAHRLCHPETCSCRKDYRIREDGVTIDWADTESEARRIVEKLKNKLPNTDNIAYNSSIKSGKEKQMKKVIFVLCAWYEYYDGSQSSFVIGAFKSKPTQEQKQDALLSFANEQQAPFSSYYKYKEMHLAEVKLLD